MSGLEAKVETQANPQQRKPEEPQRDEARGDRENGPGLALMGRLAPPAGGGGQAGHAIALSRANALRPGLAAPWMLHLQRQRGNRHVQRVVALAREAPGPIEGIEGEVSPDVERAIAGARGGGRGLDGAVRGRMESAFGTDFSGVRVHTGAQADQLNHQLSARAFATGSDIFFRHGEYNPGSSAGRELLAHELTHVVQQQGTVQTSRLTVGPPGDRFEQEADAVAREVIRGEAVAVQPGGAGVARSIQRKGGGSNFTPLRITGATFEEAAAAFASILPSQFKQNAKIAVVVINGGNLRVYDQDGQPVSQAFRLKRINEVGVGVFGLEPGSSDRGLHVVGSHANGSWDLSAGTASGDLDMARDVDPQGEFNAALSQFGYIFYVVPAVEPLSEKDQPPASQEKLPEFMKIDTANKADFPRYPSAVVPLTPQVTSVESIGKFYCKVEKYNPLAGPVGNVLNMLEEIRFRWEVLKLDAGFLVSGKETATRWKGTKARFAVRERHIQDDEKTMLGDHPERQSVPEQVVREYMKEQMAVPRRILAYTGEVALSILHSVVGNGADPNIEDFIDFKFDEPGDYFVRCIATPKPGKGTRASSVAGAMVSVFNIQDVAKESLASPADLKERAEAGVKEDEDKLDELYQKLADATDPDEQTDLDGQIKLVELRREHHTAQAKVTGDPFALRMTDLDFVRAQLAYLTGPDAPRYKSRSGQQQLLKVIERLRQEEKTIAGDLKRVDDKLGDEVHRTGVMPAVLVDDTTGARNELTFSIGERSYIASDRTEVVIADVTYEKGRRFNGLGSGRGAQGRADAWNTAMRDMRRNLNRGRGLLAWRAPERYAALSTEIDNPMKLEVAELDQLKETVDDAANALTLAALLAAPFTGGATLGLLAVLAPIQAGSSLYNIVNRALYDDLELDQEALGDLVNIATFGLAKVGTASKLAGRGVRIVATSSRIALGVLEGGMYVVMTFEAFDQLMAEHEGETPEEARVRKLRAMLEFFKNVSIAVASRALPGAHAAAGKPGSHEAGHPVETEGTVRRPVEAEPVPTPAAHPQTAAGEHLPVPAEILKAVPKDVQRHAPPVMREDLAPGTVRIVYEVNGDRVITEMRMEIGVGTDPSLVEKHVATARDMARYKGLSGRVRRIYEQITNWLTRNPRAEPGSRAWEAEREVRKLQRIVEERAGQYDAAAAGSPPNEALLAELRRELDHLESQLIEHARDVDRFDVEGRGFVAVEGRGPGGEPTFGPETTRREAFRKLGGFEARPGPAGTLEAASDLRRFADVLTGEKLIASPEDLIAQMPDPKGLSLRTVLDQTKAPWLDKLAARAKSPAEARRIADLLPEADRGAFLAALPDAVRPAAPAAPAATGERAKRPNIRDVELDEPERPSLGPGQESDWILATNATGADVYKSLTTISALPSHVEGIVVRARREGKKVTIITGYHGSAAGRTSPEKKFAVDDAKFYGKKYPDVAVIDASEMTHDERLALIDSTSGIVIVSTCYGACAKPSARVRPAGSPPLALPPGEPARTPTVPAPAEAAPASPAAPPPAPAPAATRETGKLPQIRDLEAVDVPPRPSLGPGQESDWIVATNAVHAEVYKSLDSIRNLPSHVEGIVVRARREGKKVTIITGYHGSIAGGTRPEKQFAIDDAKFYGKKYPDVDVIDTSDMTHDQRMAVIDSTSGAVIVSTCYGAYAAPSSPARPAGTLALPGRPRPLALPPGEPVKTPLLLGPGEAAPPTPAAPPPAPVPTFKTLEEILTPDKTGFVDKALQDAYARYVAEQTKAGKLAARTEEWVVLTRGGARDLLEKLLGPDYHFGTGGTGVERLVPLTEFAQPVSYMQARVEADVAAVIKHPAKLWERLGRLQTEGITGGEVGASLFSILKGNVGEILSGKIQESVLSQVRRQHRDAKLYTDVQARLVKPDGTLSAPVLFTDNVIASKRRGNLQLHSVFEVKAGSHGGQEATTQIFEWIEGHLEDGLEIRVGGEWYRYDPAATTGKRVVGLARGERHLIAVKGAEHLGQDSEFKTVREATRHALPVTAEEINYLTRLLIDRFIPKHSAPAPVPVGAP